MTNVPGWCSSLDRPRREDPVIGAKQVLPPDRCGISVRCLLCQSARLVEEGNYFPFWPQSPFVPWSQGQVVTGMWNGESQLQLNGTTFPTSIYSSLCPWLHSSDYLAGLLITSSPSVCTVSKLFSFPVLAPSLSLNVSIPVFTPRQPCLCGHTCACICLFVCLWVSKDVSQCEHSYSAIPVPSSLIVNTPVPLSHL